mmetsp:Transcript_40238/g.129352  ORF Transcript_40238/g.129352 Transcript_40238/m.129352 type:complete len:160 (+) Transcript_40238:42-521(+)
MSRLTSTFRLTLGACQASPAPPVGSALGQRGLNLMNFCKEFNDRTAAYAPGTPMQVEVRSYADRTFDFDVSTPLSSYFLKKAAGVEKGTSKPGIEWVGSISVKEIYEIAKVKMTDRKLQERSNLRTMCKSLAAQCRSIGLKVYDPRELVGADAGGERSV